MTSKIERRMISSKDIDYIQYIIVSLRTINLRPSRYHHVFDLVLPRQSTCRSLKSQYPSGRHPIVT